MGRVGIHRYTKREWKLRLISLVKQVEDLSFDLSDIREVTEGSPTGKLFHKGAMPHFSPPQVKVRVLCPILSARVISGQVLSITTCGSQT